jgi:hypothetical protein
LRSLKIEAAKNIGIISLRTFSQGASCSSSSIEAGLHFVRPGVGDEKQPQVRRLPAPSTTLRAGFEAMPLQNSFKLAQDRIASIIDVSRSGG